MKQVTRYECEWCGRLFRTPNRHMCRFDPQYRSCLSCRHCGKFEAVEVEDGTPYIGIRTVKGFHCAHDDIPIGEMWWNDFPEALYGSIYGEGKSCPDWELLPGYTGSKSFAKHQTILAAKAEGGAE